MPRFDRSLLFCALSGLLLAAAFPRPDLYPLAWGALVPMLLVADRGPFVAGYRCGLFFFAAVLYWLNIVMTSYGGLSLFFSILAYLFLVAYLALFFGAAVWLSGLCRLRWRLPYWSTLPLFWVACEYLRGWLLSGFPWALLGYSQQNFAAAIQSADVTGVYGVSFLLVAVNAALAEFILAPRRRSAVAGIVLVGFMCCTHIGYGVWRLGQDLDRREDTLQVGLVQGNVEQGQKWLPEMRQETVDRYLLLSGQALPQSELLIWPEAATPFFLQEKSGLSRQVLDFSAHEGVSLLVGSPAYERAAAEIRYYNSAFLLKPDQGLVGRSDKVHLVPFGEYVPLPWLLGFLNKMVVGVGDFSPGKLLPLDLDGKKLGVLICYEGIFPELARSYVRQGSDLLINITNDAWFGRSAAPYQHLAMVRFRAIENRVWLARSANTGISALISPSGTLSRQTPLFVQDVISGSVGLGHNGSFYTRFGDVFAWLCLFFSVLAGAFLVRKQCAAVGGS